MLLFELVHFSCVKASVFVSLHYYLYINTKINIYRYIYIYMNKQLFLSFESAATGFLHY